MTKNNKTITFTVEVEPPYTWVGIFTFMGPKDKGLAVTSNPVELYDGGILHVGENGGIYMQTTKTGVKRKTKAKTNTTTKDGDTNGRSDE